MFFRPCQCPFLVLLMIFIAKIYHFSLVLNFSTEINSLCDINYCNCFHCPCNTNKNLGNWHTKLGLLFRRMRAKLKPQTWNGVFCLGKKSNSSSIEGVKILVFFWIRFSYLSSNYSSSGLESADHFVSWLYAVTIFNRELAKTYNCTIE